MFLKCLPIHLSFDEKCVRGWGFGLFLFTLSIDCKKPNLNLVLFRLWKDCATHLKYQTLKTWYYPDLKVRIYAIREEIVTLDEMWYLWWWGAGGELRSVIEQYNPQDPRKHSCQNK